MSDKDIKYATAIAKDRDHNIEARLQIGCLEHNLVGGHVVSVVLSDRLTPGRIGLVYRIDNEEMQPRIMPVGTDLRSISLLGLEALELARAKRFRLELQPTGGPILFYDFDITGADKAIKSVPCVNRRL